MEKYERNFCEAVYPEHTDVAIAINNEKTMIMDATDKIQSLEAELKTANENLEIQTEVLDNVLKSAHTKDCINHDPHEAGCNCGFQNRYGELLTPAQDTPTSEVE